VKNQWKISLLLATFVHMTILALLRQKLYFSLNFPVIIWSG